MHRIILAAFMLLTTSQVVAERPEIVRTFGECQALHAIESRTATSDEERARHTAKFSDVFAVGATHSIEGSRIYRQTKKAEKAYSEESDKAVLLNQYKQACETIKGL